MDIKMLILGFFTPWIAYAGITLLHCILPARKIKGYVKHETSGEVLNYRINGILVLPASILIWFLLGYFEIVRFTWLYEVRWASLAGAVVIGLVFSFIIVLKAPSTGKPFLADFWFGRIKNPQFKNGFIDCLRGVRSTLRQIPYQNNNPWVVDSKMWLYLIGAVMLQLNVLSFAAYHWEAAFHLQSIASLNPGFLLGAAMATWFCWDYLIFERVHLYTYDLFAERTGFKLGFGCLTFYPYFYAVSLWCTVNLPNPGLPLWVSGIFILVFLLGWMLTRGANLQKFLFKIAPEKKFLCMKPEVVSDGNRSLLVSGFWGASRHINYLGEIVQACGIALAAGYPAVWGVWLYPLYYVGLLFTRQVDDDKICKAKYGELWDTYTKKVKYRIIPFIW